MRPTVLDDFLAQAHGRVHLESWGLGRDGHAAVKALVGALPAPERVALLKAAVAELPKLRASDAPNAHQEGLLIYAAVGALYSARLPLREADLCEVLVAAGHECGHGLDTRPPFDLARKYMRKHGYSPALGEAIATFIANLPKSSAVQIKELRRRAALIAVLGPEPVGPADSWIRSLQGHLAALQPPERTTWENLVLAMSVSERMVMPNTWRAPAEVALEQLGVERAVQRLTQWWPDAGPGGVVNLKDGGAQILEHFIWLLSLLPRSDGEPLVARLADLRFKGRDEPMAVLKPAAAYLAEASTPEARQAHAGVVARIEAAMTLATDGRLIV